VGADRTGIEGLARAERAGIPTFVHRVADFETRRDWDVALTRSVAAYGPDLVVSAGFMKLAGEDFLDAFPGRYVNTHPALLPSFPGMHGARDALRHGVRITGATLFVVDAGIDTGRSWRRPPCRCSTTTPRRRCTSGSRPSSAPCSCTAWAPWSATATAWTTER
jgi:folate-dependent phosphoribosylglycinamide formyltransferase PurN